MRIDGWSRRNLLINGNKQVNQRSYAGGVLADGVYGYDRWKGANSDANIEQVIEQINITSGLYVISWEGGGTASVNGVSGLVSGETITITVAGNVSVIVPKNATKIQLEAGATQSVFEYRSYAEELLLCQRYFEKGLTVSALGSNTNTAGNGFLTSRPFKVTKRVTPTITITSNVGTHTAVASTPTTEYASFTSSTLITVATSYIIITFDVSAEL